MALRPEPRVPHPGPFAVAVACAPLALALSGCAHPAVETRRVDLRLLSQATIDVRVDPAVQEDATMVDARVRIDRAAPGGPVVIVGVVRSDACERIRRSRIEQTVVIVREGAPEVREPPTIEIGQRSLGFHPCHPQPVAGAALETHWLRSIPASKRFETCSGFSGTTDTNGLVSVPLAALRYGACGSGGERPWQLWLRVMGEEQRLPDDVEKALLALLAEPEPRPATR